MVRRKQFIIEDIDPVTDPAQVTQGFNPICRNSLPALGLARQTRQIAFHPRDEPSSSRPMASNASTTIGP